MIRSTVFFTLFSILLKVNLAQGKKVLACYTEIDSPPISAIPSNLCTHYQLIGSTTIDWLGNFVPPKRSIARSFSKLRLKEPKPTLLLCITGPNPNWSRLVSFEGNMRKFANAAAKFLKAEGLQGLDLDWEFPYWSPDGATWDYEGFTQLIQILHETFSPQGLIVTAAVSGPPTITRTAYNVTALNEYLDLVFVMNYDFHVWKPSVPFVGFNAPLHPLPFEIMQLKEMNSESSMRSYLSLGLDKNKAIFGMPTYNQGYVLANGKWHTPYAIADEEIDIYQHHEMTCDLTKSDGWKRVWNEDAQSSYLYHEKKKIWISEETNDSFRAKATFAKDQGFGGLMMFSMGNDDWRGSCGQGPFPLIRQAKDSFFN